jgi:hypothetical protein
MAKEAVQKDTGKSENVTASLSDPVEIKKDSKKITPEDAKKMTGNVLVSGASYWDFDEQPGFVGWYRDDVFKKKGAEAGELIGYEFEDQDGDRHIISNSYAITEALKMLKDDGIDPKNVLLFIEFRGKGEKADGQSFNRFHIVDLTN